MASAASVIEQEAAAQLVTRSDLAALVFLAYDICLTFSDEVEHIWSKPAKSLIKWLFLAVRYVTLLTNIMLLFSGSPLGVAVGMSVPQNCTRFFIAQVTLLQFIIALMEIILALRVYAMYNRARWVGLTLAALFLAEEAIMAASLARTIPYVRFNSACVSLDVPSDAVYFGIAPILFEFVLLALTCTKCVSSVRATGWRRTPLLVLLLRDGTWVFLAAFVCFVLNGVFYLSISGPRNAMFFAWQYAVASFAATRLVLHMHTGAPGAAPHRHPPPCLSSTHGSRVVVGARALCGWAFRQGRAIEDSEMQGETAFALTTIPELGLDYEIEEHGGISFVEEDGISRMVSDKTV